MMKNNRSPILCSTSKMSADIVGDQRIWNELISRFIRNAKERKGYAFHTITIQRGWTNDDFAKNLITVLQEAKLFRVPRILNRIKNRSIDIVFKGDPLR